MKLTCYCQTIFVTYDIYNMVSKQYPWLSKIINNDFHIIKVHGLIKVMPCLSELCNLILSMFWNFIFRTFSGLLIRSLIYIYCKLYEIWKYICLKTIWENVICMNSIDFNNIETPINAFHQLIKPEVLNSFTR